MAHVRKPLAIAAGLNTVIFIGELIGGIKGNSNSLIMDAVHNFSDELALVCLYFAYLTKMKMSRSIQRVANVLNSIGLITIAGILIWQSVEHIFNPGTEVGYIPIISGLFAALTNWGVAKVLYKVRDQNASIRLAYVHNLGDIYVSLVPVLAGLLVLLTHKSYFDPVIAIIIGIWLIVTTGKEIARSYSDLIWPENAICKHDKGLEIQKC